MRSFMCFPPPMLLGLVLLAAPAGAQEAGQTQVSPGGVATTIESQGYEPGCVEWTYRIVPAPQNKRVRMVRLAFDFANRCGREVSVVLARQTFAGAGGAAYGGSIILAPGAVLAYEHSGQRGNYILFDPDSDRWLRFWVHQSGRRFRNGVYLDLARCNLKYPPPDPRPPKPPHPACPPAVAFGATGP